MKVLIENLLRNPHNPSPLTNTCQLQVNLGDVVTARSPEEVAWWVSPGCKRSRFEIGVELRGRPHLNLAFDTSEAAWAAWRKICPEAAGSRKAFTHYNGVRGQKDCLTDLADTTGWLKARGYEVDHSWDGSLEYGTYLVHINGVMVGKTLPEIIVNTRVVEAKSS